MGVEIEKKFLVSRIPDNLSVYDFHMIEQAYLNVHPAIRVRREDDIYYMTYDSPSKILCGTGQIGLDKLQPCRIIKLDKD